MGLIEEILSAPNCCANATQYGSLYNMQTKRYECYLHSDDIDFPLSLTPDADVND